jgi:hypothetical protein
MMAGAAMKRGLSELELDSVYTQFCKMMTDIGENGSRLFLARFALLAMTEIGDARLLEKLIADAAEDLLRREPAQSD